MDFLKMVQDNGIVGCGGAGFPAHVKWRGKADVFIVNGIECEPLLRTDRFLMQSQAEKIVKGAMLVGNVLTSKRVVIALKSHYEEEKKALEFAIKKLSSEVEIATVGNFYPAGDEQVLVYEITGKIVPPLGIPMDVGVVVSNISTVYFAYEASLGKPLIRKYITVTGAVRSPVILNVPIGISINECIKYAQPEKEKFSVILGGPLMGKVYSEDDIKEQVVTKTTSGVLILDKTCRAVTIQNVYINNILKMAKSACIQCSSCTEMCPRHLIGHPLKPHKIMRKISLTENVEEILEDYDVKQSLICSECGVCEVFACPMGIMPRKVNQILKTVLRKENVKYERTEQEYVPDAMREYRHVPSKRIAARAGVIDYYDLKIKNEVILQCKRVRIPLQQHIGVPAVPVIKKGDEVQEGQLIAKCPEGKLGANIHASISGIIVESNDKDIVIER